MRCFKGESPVFTEAYLAASAGVAAWMANQEGYAPWKAATIAADMCEAFAKETEKRLKTRAEVRVKEQEARAEALVKEREAQRVDDDRRLKASWFYNDVGLFCAQHVGPGRVYFATYGSEQHVYLDRSDVDDMLNVADDTYFKKVVVAHLSTFYAGLMSKDVELTWDGIEGEMPPRVLDVRIRGQRISEAAWDCLAQSKWLPIYEYESAKLTWNNAG